MAKDIQKDVQEQLYYTNLLVWWDNIKYKIRRLLQLYKTVETKTEKTYTKTQRQLDLYAEYFLKQANLIQINIKILKI